MPISADKLLETLKGAYQGDCDFMIPMKDRTSLGIGGPADILAVPADPLSLRNLVVVLEGKGIPFTTVGAGTNILVRDAGIEGAVIALRQFNRIEVLKEENGGAELFVEAGVPLQKLVNFCKGKGYSGIEGLAGIPGSVGGAISGNAGSFSYETKDVIESVAIMDSRGKLDRFRPEGLGFGYRQSSIPAGDIVLSANMKFRKEDRETISNLTDSFFNQKKQSQPISERSAGCVFKNPATGSAGRLIDEAGCKGMKVGGVEVSALHANFFVSRSGATASHFIALMDEVSAAVFGRFGIRLEPEIKIIGRN